MSGRWIKITLEEQIALVPEGCLARWGANDTRERTICKHRDNVTADIIDDSGGTQVQQCMIDDTGLEVWVEDEKY